MQQKIPTARIAAGFLSRGSVIRHDRSIFPAAYADTAALRLRVFGRHNMTRMDFFRFFVIGGAVGLAVKKLKIKPKLKKARFWKKVKQD